MTTVEEPPRAEKDAPAAPPSEEHTTSLRDVQQLGLFPAIKSLSYVFWWVKGFELCPFDHDAPGLGFRIKLGSEFCTDLFLDRDRFSKNHLAEQATKPCLGKP